MTTSVDQVRALLDVAGLAPSHAELDALVESFAGLRAQIEALWAVDVGDSAPALVFRAAESRASQDRDRG